MARRVKAGERLKITAAEYNRILEAADSVARDRISGGVGNKPQDRLTHTIRVHNQSATTIPIGGIVGIDQPLGDPTAGSAELARFVRDTTIQGVVPTTDHTGKFGVAIEPIAEDKLGKAVFAGVVAAQLNVANVNHKYADVHSSGGTILQSKTIGSAQILWKQTTSTGMQWSVVRLGNRPDSSQSPTSVYAFMLAEDMDGAAAATIYSLDGATVIEPSAIVVDTLGHFGHLNEGDFGLCAKEDAYYYALHPENALEPLATRAIVFRLAANLSTGIGDTASAIVLQSGDPDVAVGDTVSVFNTGGFQGYGPTGGVLGATGVATKIGNQWWVVVLNQLAPLIEITLTSDSHLTPSTSSTGPHLPVSPTIGGGNTGAISHQIPITFTNPKAITPFPFSWLGGYITVSNPHNFEYLGNSEGGDKALIAYDQYFSQWVIKQVYRRRARSILFRLYSNPPSSWSGASTLTGARAVSAVAIGQTSESDTGDLPSGTITLWDPFLKTAHSETGDIGYANFNFRDKHWEIMECTGQARYMLAQVQWGLGGISYPGHGEYANTIPITISQPLEGRHPGITPTGAGVTQGYTANNYCRIRNVQNGPAIVKWNHVQMRWELIQANIWPVATEEPT